MDGTSFTNIQGEKFICREDSYYSLDINQYVDCVPTAEVYYDPHRKVFSRRKETFYLFYILNGIPVQPSRASTAIIDKIPIEELHHLTNFSLEGYLTKARVMKVISGNILELAFFLTAEFINSYHAGFKKGKYNLVKNGITYLGDNGFFMRKRCRINGITLSSEEYKKELAKEFLTTLCNELGLSVYVQFKGSDKYTPEIEIVDLFAGDCQFNFDSFLINYRDLTNGQLFF